MDLNELFVFAKVVQAGSFVRAARDLGMPKSTVSRRVFELETRLGARLLERTTRSLRLTEVGREYFVRAERIVADAEEAEAAVLELQAEPRGSLRVAAPQNFGPLGAIGQAFLERHPRVRLELVCSDRMVDLVAEGFDLAVRVGRLADSALIARALGTIRNVLVASPHLFEEHPLPTSPVQLTSLPCIAFGGAAERARWELSGESGQSCTLRIEPRFVANDFEVLAAASRSGLGVALLPEQRCSELLRAGTLQRVLPEWSSIVRTVHAVYPSSRHLSPKVTAFVEHLAVAFASAPGFEP
jgi:DNA-binding transcriptional LysR family regulator